MIENLIISIIGFIGVAWASLSLAKRIIQKKGWLEWRGEYAIKGKLYWYGPEIKPDQGACILVEWLDGRTASTRGVSCEEYMRHRLCKWAYIGDQKNLPGKTS